MAELQAAYMAAWKPGVKRRGRRSLRPHFMFTEVVSSRSIRQPTAPVVCFYLLDDVDNMAAVVCARTAALAS